MPHLRLEVPAEWLNLEGFDAGRLLAELVQGVAESTMPINLSNLKHAVIPVYSSGVGGDPAKRFLHITLAAGNDTPGRTAAVRREVAEKLGGIADAFTSGLPGLASVTVHVIDIDRDRGYSTTAERRNKTRTIP